MITAIQKSNPTVISLPTLATLPIEARVLATAIIVVLALGMLGAVGQIVIHDIIPTFFSDKPMEHRGQSTANKPEEGSVDSRGDLFGELPADSVTVSSKPKAIYQQEQFVWLLKWTHIHLFGMSIIFIFVGGITVLLNLNSGTKAWLVILPFAGVWIDIAAMWLKAYVSPAFFWLHLPGGAMFSGIFVFVLIRSLMEMWGTKRVTHEN